MILQHQDNLEQALTILQTMDTDDLHSSYVYGVSKGDVQNQDIVISVQGWSSLKCLK